MKALVKSFERLKELDGWNMPLNNEKDNLWHELFFASEMFCFCGKEINVKNDCDHIWSDINNGWCWHIEFFEFIKNDIGKFVYRDFSFKEEQEIANVDQKPITTLFELNRLSYYRKSVCITYGVNKSKPIPASWAMQWQGSRLFKLFNDRSLFEYKKKSKSNFFKAKLGMENK